MGKPLPRPFFQRPHLQVARALIGCRLVHGECVGRVVEAESYAARGDAACHTAVRPSCRAFLAAHPAGTAYVYLNYGVHWLLNVLAKDGRRDGIILLRAVEPIAGLETMRMRRGDVAPRHLCSGPGKLAAAFGLDSTHHGCDLTRPGAGPTLLPADDLAPRLVRTPRIGIRVAVDKRWRFCAEGSTFLSR
jgi:DNA-3-methyladenine glycosylase